MSETNGPRCKCGFGQWRSAGPNPDCPLHGDEIIARIVVRDGEVRTEPASVGAPDTSRAAPSMVHWCARQQRIVNYPSLACSTCMGHGATDFLPVTPDTSRADLAARLEMWAVEDYVGLSMGHRANLRRVLREAAAALRDTRPTDDALRALDALIRDGRSLLVRSADDELTFTAEEQYAAFAERITNIIAPKGGAAALLLWVRDEVGRCLLTDDGCYPDDVEHYDEHTSTARAALSPQVRDAIDAASGEE